MNNQERDDWVNKRSENTMEIFDLCKRMLSTIDTNFSVISEAEYIVVKWGNRSSYSVKFFPRINFLKIASRSKSKDTWHDKLEAVGIETLRGRPKNEVLFRLHTRQDIDSNRELIIAIFKDAYVQN